MFYREASNQYIYEGIAFVVDGIQYPSTWLNTSTPEEKAALGLQEVVVIGSAANQMYYWVSEVLDKATLTITNTPKDLNVCKKIATDQTNSTAYTLLFPSDWMVIKSIETSTPVAADWNSYREAVRTTANLAKTEYANFTTVDEIANFSIQWPICPSKL